MKKILCALFSALLIFSMSSCSAKTVLPTDAPDLDPVGGMSGDGPQHPIDPPSDPDIVSSLAEENFMDVPEYSSEREYPVEFVMIHFSSDVVANKKYPYGLNAVRRTFENSEVSTHYIIDRGGNIYCWIPEQRVAWHAGKGEWKDDPKYSNTMNKYSIGIEILAIGSKKDMSGYLTSSQYNSISKSLIGYTEAQYQALIALLKDICDRWDVPKDRDHIIGHQEYAPGRKTDPGELFNWNKVISGLNAE